MIKSGREDSEEGAGELERKKGKRKRGKARLTIEHCSLSVLSLVLVVHALSAVVIGPILCRNE